MDAPQKPLADLRANSVKHMAALEGLLAPIFAKAPHLPANARATLVNIAPWLALVFGILGIVGILSAGAISSVLLSFAWIDGGTTQIALAIAMIAGLLASVLELLAWKPLSERKKQGWNYLFYGTVLTAASSILDMLFGFGTVGNLLGILIGFWLLFEVRSAYAA